MFVAGIMTGTSLDGIDIAILDISGDIENGFRKELIAFRTFQFKENTRTAIMKILNEDFFAFEISQLNFVLAKQFHKYLQELCLDSNFEYDNIEAVGVHGQTIWHQPFPKRFAGEITSSTLQIFSGSAFNAISGKKIIYDFRSADIALGGQGAPLVPIFDYYFHSNSNKNTIMLNIGGIANITYIPKNSNKSELIAFDTGPGNVLIDLAMQKLFKKNYDNNGEIARSGNINSDLMHKLTNIDYIQREPPKSTGREMFNPILLNNILSKDYIDNDVICTLTEFTAKSIADNIIIYTNPDSDIIVTGGGAGNRFLIERLENYLPISKISNGIEVGINTDSKEAECFAFLAYLNIKKIPANIPSVTGASREIILGVSAG